MLRIPGQSAGADKEAAFAEENGIPVYHSIEELKDGIHCPSA
jgi:NAD-dependent oxidoreductase involved in siderophore biosynthesis